VNLPPGYASRPASRDDLDAIVRLVDAVDLHDAGLTDPVRDELLWEWNEPRFEVARDARVVLDGGTTLVAYADVHVHDPSVQVRSWTQVHPEHRDAGLTAAVLEWVETHARSRLPADVRTTPLRHGGQATDHHTAGLLRGRGFTHVRTFRQMARPIASEEAEPRNVEGIAFRVSEPGRDDRAIFDVDDGAFRDHFGYEPSPFEEWREHWFSDENYDPTLVFLAFDGDRAVGLNLTLIEEDIGWVGVLGVLAPWRRRGIARALLERSFAELARRGIGEVRLGVDADNADRATHLYESSGMSLRREWHIYEKPISAG
jgi:mycothiol synthase